MKIRETEDRKFIQDQLFDKLRREVLSTTQPLSNRSLKSMTYLNHVINGCLRLHAPVNAVIRTRLSDCRLLCGGRPNGPIYIRAGTHVFMNFGAIHTDQDL
ncbi:hypothetical protein BCON_0161g00010 [Botryotinia convoluta]|uniref:Uncharacterized protein n=1 Tax=Botryotinia convoluta TaxID=54673 RepID=A0A4Z1HQW7_9HELO|nr:hypothetical protein BCON_0161g00010 [Botryotinia convoluta]